MVTLALVVDPEAALSEANRSDNRRELELAVAPRPPSGSELAVVSVERIAEPGQPGAIRVVVRNSGKTAVEAPVVVRVDGRVVATRLSGPIAAGQEATIEAPFPPAKAITELSAEISPRFRREERDPNDNVLRRTPATV